VNDRWDDDALLDSLRDALEHTEPAPANVDQVIDTAFSIMDVDEEIAELLDDSMVGASAMRGEDTARTLSFAAGSVQLSAGRGPSGGRATDSRRGYPHWPRTRSPVRRRRG